MSEPLARAAIAGAGPTASAASTAETANAQGDALALKLGGQPPE